MIKILFLSIFTVISIQGMMPQNKFFQSARLGHVELMEKALLEGADVNAIGGFQVTALMEAVFSNNKKSIDWLIEHKANIDLPDSEGNTLLMLNPDIDAIDMIFLCVDPVKPDTILPLIQAGAKINAQNKKGMTPLMFAASRNELPLIELFIKSRALIDQKNSDNKTAIDIANENNNKEIAEYLEKVRSENIEKSKERILQEAEQYVSGGQKGPLQYILEYAEEYVPEN